MSFTIKLLASLNPITSFNNKIDKNNSIVIIKCLKNWLIPKNIKKLAKLKGIKNSVKFKTF